MLDAVLKQKAVIN